MVVNCVVYQRGRRLSDVPLSEVRANLDRRDCFVWVALKDPQPGELASLQEEFNLHELAIEDAQKGHQRPKIEDRYFPVLDGLTAEIEEVEERGGLGIQRRWRRWS